MDTGECEADFSESELVRVLSEKSMVLYYRLKQARDLEAAQIPGLETCPWCPFAMIIEDPNEKLFRYVVRPVFAMIGESIPS